MINFDDVTKQNIREHNPNWPQIPDHPHRILIIGGSRSGKANPLFNLIYHQPSIDKIYLERFIWSKILLIKKGESTGLKRLNDSKAFIEYANDTGDIYKNIEKYNPNKEHEIFIFLIKWYPSNKKLNPIVTEFFIRGRKLNISLRFMKNLIQ